MRFQGNAAARRKIVLTGRRARDADDQPVDPQTAATEDIPRKGPPSRGEPAKARRVHARLYYDAEEAEFGAPQSCEGAPHQRLRSHRLYPRRSPQPAGTF